MKAGGGTGAGRARWGRTELGQMLHASLTEADAYELPGSLV